VRLPAAAVRQYVRHVAIPERIPIKHEPDYRTRYIGRYADGYFFGDVTGAFPESYQLGDGDWKRHKRWYAVLHLFDQDGHHVRTDTWLAGTTADGERRVIDDAVRMRESWLNRLESVEFGDIAVRLFRVDVDDVVFGLLDESDEQRGEHVELRPQELGFHPPWEGEYDT
jgi:hypothetical protein